MYKMKIGLIGCGGIARVHVEKLKMIKEIQIVAFSDIEEERVKLFVKEYGGRSYKDWHEMLDKEDLDIVYCCLPPFAHTDEVMVAAEKGVHIFIEKPIALNMKLARQMVKSIEKNDVKSQVGYCIRFEYALEEAKKLIESGEAGKPGLIHGLYWCNFIGNGWWRDRNLSGGQVTEQATHIYDALRYLCGDVEEVYGQMNRLFWTNVPDLTNEDISSTTVKFKSGALGSITSTTWGPSNQWLFRWMMAAKNYTMYSENTSTLTLYSTSTPEKCITHSQKKDRFLLESKDLINAVINDKKTRIPIQEGAKSLEFTLAVRKSMETGVPVKLPLL
jgi:predicted dehydrogenase